MAVEELATLAGWGAAVIALAVAGVLRVRLIRSIVLVAEAAHELRGPLTAAGLALHGAGGDPGRLAAAELELRRAGLALDDLVGAPRGRRTTPTFQQLDVRAVAGEVVAAARPVAARYGAAVRLDVSGGSVRVCADRLRLAQALVNLVVNAAEHGAGDVVVRVAPRGAHVRIEIHDGGPGPAPATLAAALRRSCTAGMRGLTAASLGVRGHGLAIAARVAAEHGGRLFSEPVPPLTARPSLAASSLPREGAAVVLELPRDAQRAAAARPLRRSAGFIRSPRARQLDPAVPRPPRRTGGLVQPGRGTDRDASALPPRRTGGSVQSGRGTDRDVSAIPPRRTGGFVRVSRATEPGPVPKRSGPTGMRAPSGGRPTARRGSASGPPHSSGSR